MPISYHYDPETFIFDGTMDTPVDPLESLKVGHLVYMQAANTTLTAPPEVKDGYDIVYNTTSKTWEYRQQPVEEVLQEPTEATPSITKQIIALEDYLYSTDWYVVRYTETGAEIPQEIRTQRQSARDEISRLREQLVTDGE